MTFRVLDTMMLIWDKQCAKKPATVKLDIQRCTSIRTSTVYGIHTHISQMIANHILTDMYDIVQQLNANLAWYLLATKKCTIPSLAEEQSSPQRQSPLPMHSDNQNCQRQCHPFAYSFHPFWDKPTHPPHLLKKLTSPSIERRHSPKFSQALMTAFQATTSRCTSARCMVSRRLKASGHRLPALESGGPDAGKIWWFFEGVP